MKLVTIGCGEYEGKYRKWDSWTDDEYRPLPAGTYLKKRGRQMIVALNKDTPSAKHSYVEVRPIQKSDKRHGQPTEFEKLIRGVTSAEEFGLTEARKAMDKAIEIRTAHRAARMKKGFDGTRQRYIIEGLKEAQAILKDMENGARKRAKRDRAHKAARRYESGEAFNP